MSVAYFSPVAEFVLKVWTEAHGIHASRCEYTYVLVSHEFIAIFTM